LKIYCDDNCSLSKSLSLSLSGCIDGYAGESTLQWTSLPFRGVEILQYPSCYCNQG